MSFFLETRLSCCINAILTLTILVSISFLAGCNKMTSKNRASKQHDVVLSVTVKDSGEIRLDNNKVDYQTLSTTVTNGLANDLWTEIHYHSGKKDTDLARMVRKFLEEVSTKENVKLKHFHAQGFALDLFKNKDLPADGLPRTTLPTDP
jgi:hypothetical protein